MLRTTLDWQELHCAGAGKGAFGASLASIWVETYSIQTYCLSLSALKNILKLVDVEAFFSSAVELKQLWLLKNTSFAICGFGLDSNFSGAIHSQLSLNANTALAR